MSGWCNIIQYLTNSLSYVHQKFNKGRDNYVKEIQALQKYVGIVYDPNDLSRTKQMLLLKVK